MKQLLKRSFVFIITFVLIFSITVPCFASDTSSHGGGGGQYVNMTDEEKKDWWSFRLNYYLARLVGLEEDAAYNFAVDKLLPYVDVKGYSTLEEYFLDHVNYNDETDSFDPDDEMIADINICLEQYNDSVTMVYRYPVQMQHVSAETFPNKNVYDAFIALCQAYPDCYIVTGSSNTFNYRGCGYLDVDGSAQAFSGLMSGSDFYLFGVIPSPFCGVGASLDLASTSTQFYNDNWETSFPVKTFCFTTDGRLLYSLPDCYNTGLYFQQFNFDDFPSLDVVDTVQPLSFYGTSFATFLSNSYSTSLSARTAYSASQMAINVYKSEADMKKDIGSQVIGGYTPDYSGSCGSSVSVDVINNIEIPDSGGGSGSGSDDSGGSSGGSGIIDGFGKLFGAIGNIIDKLFGFVLGLLSKVVEFFASILEMFTDTLTKLIDIIPAGFNEFLAAMFPYIPEEMITIAQFIMLVSAIGCVVALFKR